MRKTDRVRQDNRFHVSLIAMEVAGRLKDQIDDSVYIFKIG